MDLSLVVAAAEHAERSKAPFYVVGVLWAGFAVVLSVFGFKRPDFPTGSGAARAVMGASVVLMVGAMSMAVYVSG